MARHHLKTWPAPFAALWVGAKTFEVRKNDRGFAVDDTLILQEWFPEGSQWGERIVSADVAYILHGSFGVQPGYVVMALKNVRHEYYEGDAADDAA